MVDGVLHRPGLFGTVDIVNGNGGTSGGPRFLRKRRASVRAGSGPILFWGGSSAAAPVGNNRGDASHPCRPGNNAQRRAQRRSLANQIKKSGDQPTAGSDRTTFDHFGTISRSRSSVNRATPPTFQAMFTNRCPPPSRPVRSAINRAARAHWPDRRASNAFASVVARFP